MIGLDSQARIWLCTEPTDMRKSFRGLSALVRNQLKHDPLSGLVSSMSAIGHCGDNAACEGFFGMLKRERVHHRRYRTQNEARADVFDYVERFHNPRMRRRVAAQDLKLSAVLKPSVETG